MSLEHGGPSPEEMGIKPNKEEKQKGVTTERKTRYATLFHTFDNEADAEKFIREVNELSLDKIGDTLKEIDNQIPFNFKIEQGNSWPAEIGDFSKDEVTKAWATLFSSHPSRANMTEALDVIRKLIKMAELRPSLSNKVNLKLVPKTDQLNKARHFLKRQLDQMPK